MQERNSIDQIVCAARHGELALDAAVAAVTGEVLRDPDLRETVVKLMIAQIMMNKWEWDEPPLAKMIADLNEIKAWLAERKEAGKRIDTDNAEVTFRWAQVLDPYGVRRDLSDEEYCVGRS